MLKSIILKKGALLLLPMITFALLFLTPQKSFTFEVYARSGCCSHHGGVCGCGCCDGTSLSTTCAPYYPECSQPAYIAPTIHPTPDMKRVETIVPIETVKPLVPRVVVQQSGPKTQSSSADSVWRIGILGLIGYISYKTIKRLRNK